MSSTSWPWAQLASAWQHPWLNGWNHEDTNLGVPPLACKCKNASANGRPRRTACMITIGSKTTSETVAQIRNCSSTKQQIMSCNVFPQWTCSVHSKVLTSQWWTLAQLKKWHSRSKAAMQSSLDCCWVSWAEAVINVYWKYLIKINEQVNKIINKSRYTHTLYIYIYN